MNCDRCGDEIPPGEETEYGGRTLCEDCAMDALSPAIACDPWAVRSAQTLSQLDERHSTLTGNQARILQLLEDTGGAEPEVIAQRLRMTLPQLEREIATLRHMEKVRGQMREGRRILCLWDA